MKKITESKSRCKGTCDNIIILLLGIHVYFFCAWPRLVSTNTPPQLINQGTTHTGGRRVYLHFSIPDSALISRALSTCCTAVSSACLAFFSRSLNQLIFVTSSYIFYLYHPPLVFSVNLIGHEAGKVGGGDFAAAPPCCTV